MNELKIAQKDNEFLVNVYDDYLSHFKYIKEQKQKQYDALYKISEYIDKMTIDPTMTDLLLRQSKLDQHAILNKMKSIKKELDSMVKNI